ncbi:hypothetical protein HXA31_15745 [Salipaludibacillus agaradhaerens]|uniref:Uncharacterized protein n=1 Tax=Salipaludibacillus agaradhaerens TaxID=76935 RepID=A0A9Q4B6E2_SALAG|nr:hypothetical protein [Salipaludibacillus agaradhaerens]MCR6098817.1 hypothetical protein [Salipaludibacillus agaradhaerens]MCR6115824.1 hypothetical protein [Salipaludibacillus agaradhaerens]
MAMIQFPNELKQGSTTVLIPIKDLAHKAARGLSIWNTFSKTLGKEVDEDNR